MYDQLYDEQLSLIKKEAAHLVEDITPLQKFATFARENKYNYELNDFADPYRKRFPIKDKYNAYLSKVYLNKTASKKDGDFAEIDGRINRALKNFGIDPDAVLPQLDQMIEKDASEEVQTYALEIDGKQLFPIDTQVDMQKAANYFHSKYKQFSLQEKRQFSSNLIKKIASENVDVELPDTKLLQHAIASDIQENTKIIKQAFEMKPIIEKQTALLLLGNYKHMVKKAHSKDALEKALDLIEASKDNITSSRTISKIANLVEKIANHENETFEIEDLISYFEGVERD